jgi:hypothetical protein
MSRAESSLLDCLKTSLYKPRDYALVKQVPSILGDLDVFDPRRRYADGIAIAWSSPDAIFFEVKETFRDFSAELGNGAKSIDFREYCGEWYFVVPSKKIVPSLSLLPRGWGLIVVDRGDAYVELPSRGAPAPRPMTVDDHIRFLRAALNEQRREEAGIAGAPIEKVVARISQAFVGLACGHWAQSSLVSKRGDTAPCLSCKEGKPIPREMAEHVIALGDIDDNAA